MSANCLRSPICGARIRHADMVVVNRAHIHRAAAEGFLSEFYHPDHGEQKRKVRVMVVVLASIA